jgi:hypothetical protein
MGDLQALGSEKLNGMDKIKRILEISKFRENIPNPINETHRNDYKLTMVNGQEYQIVKERQGYIIKKTISESVTDYIEPMKNRKYYSSYGQALKRLNLMTKEVNRLTENEEGISLFTEQKKFVLKTPQKAAPAPSDDVENVPPPPPPPPSPDASAPEDIPSDLPAAPGDEEMTSLGGEDMGPEEGEGDEDTMGMEGEDDHEGVVTFKTIQKLTGKLGQKLRTLESQGEEPMSSKDIKYVINSILSALDLSKMDEEDIEEITSKFEDIEFDGETGDDEESTMGGDEMGPEEGGDDDMGDEEAPPAGEMEESWTDFGSQMANKALGSMIAPKESNESMDHYHKIGMIADEMFTESKVENILSRYFIVSENEKKHNKVINQNRTKSKKIEIKNRNTELKRLSESIHQEIASRKFLQNYNDAKLIGKTNKKNLVFECENKQYKITPKGEIL